jgi:hypothetical protein
MRIRQVIPVALTLGVLVMVSLAPSSRPSASPSTALSLTPSSTGHLPISFEANQGQADSSVRFLAHGPGYSLFLTPTEALLALSASGQAPLSSRDPASPAAVDAPSLASASPPMLVGMQFLNADPQPEITGDHQLPGIVNYLLGNDPARWHTNIPTYAQVRYHNIYPGIDLVYYGNQGQLEYDFIVAPGSDPSQIHLSFTGANSLSLDAQGQLLLHLPGGDIPEGALRVYQEINGVQQRIVGRYVLQSRTEIGFALGTYDASQPLVIDPVLLFSTYLGGLDNDSSTALALDSMGNVYITGSTSSTNFPTQNPLQPTYSGGPSDAFVTKMNAAGTALVYSTYLGGNGADGGTGIAVDGAGNAYITGITFSTNFPVQNPLQPTSGGGPDDAFIAKLNATGTALVYSTYLGGNGADWSTGIAVDGAGNAYITGGTSSTNFPMQSPLQSTNAGTANAFVAELNAAGSALVYSTYLGGSNYDYAAGIALDNVGDAYIIGTTHSTNFPTQNPVQSTNAGGGDAFVAKLKAAGTALVYSTYLGGSGTDIGSAIAVDSAGNAYITGSTSSANFPTQNPVQSTNAGSADVFIAKLNSVGSALIYSTYLGGSNDDRASSIVIDDAGNAYITGSTSSTNFPTQSPLQSTNAGGTDAFIAQLGGAGNTLLYSSYLGGSSNDNGNAIAADSIGNIYVAGATASFDFPTFKPIQAYGGMGDGFLVKMNPKTPAQFQISSQAIALITTPGISPSQQTLTLSNVGGALLNWAANSLPSWVSVSPSSGSLPAGNTQILTLTFNTPSTTPQTYTTDLVLTDPNAGNSPFSLPITVVSANVSKTWYFAEGYTGGSFTEYLTIANPNTSITTVTVTYLLQGAAPVIRTYQVGANARYTINVNSVIGPNQNVSMVVTGSQPIIAERPMYFTYTGLAGFSIPGGSAVLGATSLAQQFDFGYLDTTTGHDTWLTILNQNSSPMTVTVQYFPQGGGTPFVRTHQVPANNRGTIHVNSEGLPADRYSALVSLNEPGLVERPLYLKDQNTGYTGSADVVGVAQPQGNWYFAEGYVSSTFHEDYIVSNPSTSTSAAVTFTFFQGGGTPKTAQLTLGPGQQQILDVGTLLQGNNSALVSATGPILAERVMSFKYTGPVGTQGGSSIPGASDVLGAATPSSLFYFAEGYTGGQFAEYLTIENPDPANTATVTVTFLPSNGGAPVVKVYAIPPNSRFTLFTNGVISNQSFSMIVESNVPVVAERPMYFAYNGTQTGGSDVIGYQP